MASLGYASGAEVNSALIAGSVNTSSSFVRRTLAKLSKAGLVETATGKRGACWLARPARNISLLEIYRAVDAPKAFAIHHRDTPVKEHFVPIGSLCDHGSMRRPKKFHREDALKKASDGHSYRSFAITHFGGPRID